MIFRRDIGILIMSGMFVSFIYCQNKDSTYNYEKLSFRIDWKGIYINSSIRSTNYVRRVELAYNIRNRLNIGVSAFWGWRFGKNFGEDIGFDINTKKENTTNYVKSSSHYPTMQDKYTFKEWLYSLGQEYTALNYKYSGFGMFAEYQLDKNGIFEVFGKRYVHLWVYLGCSYVSGLVAGDLLYIKENYSGSIFGGQTVYSYVYLYEKIRYQNVSADIMVRMRMHPKKKDWVLPSLSVYYIYTPDQAKNGMKNFGWLWDLRFIIWKRK